MYAIFSMSRLKISLIRVSAKSWLCSSKLFPSVIVLQAFDIDADLIIFAAHNLAEAARSHICARSQVVMLCYPSLATTRRLRPNASELIDDLLNLRNHSSMFNDPTVLTSLNYKGSVDDSAVNFWISMVLLTTYLGLLPLELHRLLTMTFQTALLWACLSCYNQVLWTLLDPKCSQTSYFLYSYSSVFTLKSTS